MELTVDIGLEHNLVYIKIMCNCIHLKSAVPIPLGFQAHIMILLSSGLVLIVSITFCN